MVSFYEEKMKIATNVLKFAEKGFFDEVCEIAKKLAVADSKTEVVALYEQLALAIEAVKVTEKDLECALEQYEEAVAREEKQP